MTLTDKVELYFQDHSIMPLFVQENYLKSKFSRAGTASGPELALKNLELMTKAADSISDGDLVDAMIHGCVPLFSFLSAGPSPSSSTLPQSSAALESHAASRNALLCPSGVVLLRSRRRLPCFPGVSSAPSFVSPSLLTRFPSSLYSWLGKNSTQNKLQRMLGEIQIRMRLRVSGDRREIRQSYIPALYPRLVNPLQDEGTVRSSVSRSSQLRD